MTGDDKSSSPGNIYQFDILSIITSCVAHMACLSCGHLLLHRSRETKALWCTSVGVGPWLKLELGR